jgi:precorrin-6y C5,15-methyltransferase (decarboxylating) CbiE subunit
MGSLTTSIAICGCGPGSREYVTPIVEQAVSEASVITGVPRLLDLFPDSNARRIPLEGSIDLWIARLIETVNERIAVLVTGDAGCCSLATRVIAKFGRDRCRVIAGISSVQVACAKLGLSWANARIIRAHATLPKFEVNELVPYDPWIILMGAEGAEQMVADMVQNRGRDCYVCEDLTLASERIIKLAAGALAVLSTHPRRIVVLTRKFENE